jgi:hypothetical protein
VPWAIRPHKRVWRPAIVGRTDNYYECVIWLDAFFMAFLATRRHFAVYDAAPRREWRAAANRPVPHGFGQHRGYGFCIARRSGAAVSRGRATTNADHRFRHRQLVRGLLGARPCPFWSPITLGRTPRRSLRLWRKQASAYPSSQGPAARVQWTLLSTWWSSASRASSTSAFNFVSGSRRGTISAPFSS